MTDKEEQKYFAIPVIGYRPNGGKAGWDSLDPLDQAAGGAGYWKVW
jgi:hypothetical protein